MEERESGRLRHRWYVQDEERFWSRQEEMERRGIEAEIDRFADQATRSFRRFDECVTQGRDYDEWAEWARDMTLLAGRVLRRARKLADRWGAAAVAARTQDEAQGETAASKAPAESSAVPFGQPAPALSQSFAAREDQAPAAEAKTAPQAASSKPASPAPSQASTPSATSDAPPTPPASGPNASAGKRKRKVSRNELRRLREETKRSRKRAALAGA